MSLMITPATAPVTDGTSDAAADEAGKSEAAAQFASALADAQPASTGKATHDGSTQRKQCREEKGGSERDVRDQETVADAIATPVVLQLLAQFGQSPSAVFTTQPQSVKSETPASNSVGSALATASAGIATSAGAAASADVVAAAVETKSAPTGTSRSETMTGLSEPSARSVPFTSSMPNTSSSSMEGAPSGLPPAALPGWQPVVASAPVTAPTASSSGSPTARVGSPHLATIPTLVPVSAAKPTPVPSADPAVARPVQDSQPARARPAADPISGGGSTVAELATVVSEINLARPTATIENVPSSSIKSGQTSIQFGQKSVAVAGVVARPSTPLGATPVTTAAPVHAGSNSNTPTAVVATPASAQAATHADADPGDGKRKREISPTSSTDAVLSPVPLNLPAASAAPTRTPVPVANPSAQSTVAPHELAAPIIKLRYHGDGDHEITLMLHPADLGQVNVHVRLTGPEMTIQLASTSESARTALHEALPHLRSELQNAGLSSNISLSLGAGSQSSSQDSPSRGHTEPTDPISYNADLPTKQRGTQSATAGSGALDRFL